MPAKRAPFSPAGDKLVLATVDNDGPQLEVTAQYNPKELALQAQATWNKASNAHAGNPATSHDLRLEYASTDPQTYAFDLLFDGVEEGGSVRDLIHRLVKLTQPRNMGSKRAKDRRPPLCIAIWGGEPAFRCVVTSVATKITAFAADGAPLRATCTIALKEADIVSMWNDDDARDGGRADHAGDVAAAERHTADVSQLE